MLGAAVELVVEDGASTDVRRHARLAVDDLADRGDGFDLVVERVGVVGEASDDAGEVAVFGDDVADVELVGQGALADGGQRDRVDRQLDQVADLEQVVPACD